MVLAHKFLASMLLVAMLAAGPLCTCAAAMADAMPHAEAMATMAGHTACNDQEKSHEMHGDCQEQCHDSAVEQATLVPFEAVVTSSTQADDAFIVELESIAPPPHFSRISQRAPPPNDWRSAPQTLVSLHTLLLN